MQEVAGSTPAFSTKERRTDGCAVFCWPQKQEDFSPPLHVQQAGVALEAAECEEQDERNEQRVLPEGDEDVHPGIGAANRLFGG